MVNGNPEFADLIYDWIKSRHPSASKSYPGYYADGTMDIFVDGRWVCQVMGDKVYSYHFTFGKKNAIRPADPQLFDKIAAICSWR